MANEDLMSGTIDRGTEINTDIAGQEAILGHITQSLDEGIAVPDIKNKLMSEQGFDESMATTSLSQALKPRISSALEETDKDELRSTLATDYGYDETLLSELFDKQEITEPDIETQYDVKEYEQIPLVPVAEENSVTQEDVEDLAVAARSVHQFQLPLFKGLYSSMLDDEEGKKEFARINMETSTKIANTLRKMGKNVEVTPSGELVEVLEGGITKEVDEAFLSSIASAEYEIMGGILGSYTGYKVASHASKALFGGKFGWMTKLATLTGSSVLAAAGASSGRTLDVLHNAIKVKENVDAQLLKSHMVDAGVFSATAATFVVFICAKPPNLEGL